MRGRGEVTDEQNQISGRTSFAEKADDASVRIAEIDPFEARGLAIPFIERRLAPKRGVQIAHPAQEATVTRVALEMPVQGRIGIPFVPLPKVAPHEDQLFAWMSEHIAVQKPQVRKLSPIVARHPADERTHTVSDLIMRQREDELFLERAREIRKDLTVVNVAPHGVDGHIGHGVTHPVYVPFETELLRDHYGGRMFGVDTLE